MRTSLKAAPAALGSSFALRFDTRMHSEEEDALGEGGGAERCDGRVRGAFGELAFRARA